MTTKLDVLASELPVLEHKSSYKYLDEIAGNGKYYQVAWQKVENNYIALYGTHDLKIVESVNPEIIFPNEEE